jgi:glycine/D-amino acid oxidase-like deaminating enzyme
MAVARRRVQQWRAHGFDVRLLERDEVNALLGTDSYHGGWTAPTGGQVNPLGLTRGIARAALEAGAQVHFDSPVTGMQRSAGGWTLQTAQGRVVAGKVFLATAAYTDGLWPGLARSVVPIVNWQLSTRPLPPEIRARVMPANMTMSDTHGDLRFARLDAFGRLVSGAALIVPWNAEARLRRLIAQRLQALFPALRELPPQEFDHAWNGLIAMTPDFLPHFHELDPGVFAALGCNGRGLSMSVALGRAMADALRGVPSGDLEVPLTAPRPLVAHAIARRVAAGMLAVYRYRDGRD